jgi:methyltransferase (TIGR00027 family)
VRGRPSLTARHVAWQRAQLDRPAGPAGDPDAEHRLEASLRGWLFLPVRAGVPMAARTRFFDTQTQSAIQAGVRQVVILGAGYDGRAMRFAHPGARFFEVDHADTQADKRRRLRQARVDPSTVTLVAADLAKDDLDVVLCAAGFDDTLLALVLCEGLLPYLTPAQAEHLLRSVFGLVAPGSALACNFHVRPPSSAPRTRLSRGAVDGLLRLIGEPRLCEFAPGDPEQLLETTGWSIDTRIEADHEAHHGYGVLVRALRP